MKASSAERYSTFDTLRSYYHSLNEEDRRQAIEALSEMNDPDAARELMQIFKDCHWRTTRLQIIRVLSKFPTQRSLEFLFSLARDEGDLPIAEAAIESLGRTHHAQASKFLVSFYMCVPETLKPAVVAALGEIPDRTLVTEFIKDLSKAMRMDNIHLARNLTLSLGELKAREALPFLEEIVVQNKNAELVLSALVSIGKIARNPFMLVSWEDRFRKNLLEHQIFCSVKTQVHCRSQWKLEDYLTRLFEGPEVHQVLPYELHHFSPADVLEGLKIYNVPAYFKRLCLVLSKIDFTGMASWYQQLFDFENLSAEQSCIVLESVSAHFSREMLPVIRAVKKQALKDRDSHLYKKWLEALALSLPQANLEFEELFKSVEYNEFTDSHRIQAINAFVQFGLCAQGNPPVMESVVRIFESLLLREKSHLVQGRVIRALGSLHAHNRKILDWVRGGILNPLLTSSCLYYLENSPEKKGSWAVLQLILKDRGFCRLYATALLRALSSNSSCDLASKDLHLFLQECLREDSGIEEKTLALSFFETHPIHQFLDQILNLLQSDSRLKLPAVIALKGFPTEKASDVIGACLQSGDYSLSGRALDTLSALPGMRAKRLIIDFLRDHPEDLDICDKVIRSLEVPSMGHDYFTGVLDEILIRFPMHPRLEGLLGLKEKLAGTVVPGDSQTMGPEISRIDLELKIKLKGYEKYDESVKAALRSAELTYQHPELFDQWVDKSSSVVAFCKATDLLLEKGLGQKKLSHALERNLHLFQNVLYSLSLNEESVDPGRLLSALSLERHFTIQNLPLHKMILVSKGILSGRILNEEFKILDGLRSWAIILLIFCREIKGMKPLISLPHFSNESIIALAKRLLDLQEIRNGAAHRKTLLDLVMVDKVRKEVFGIINLIEEIAE